MARHGSSLTITTTGWVATVCVMGSRVFCRGRSVVIASNMIWVLGVKGVRRSGIEDFFD
jgi:hypothetical protein